MRKDAIIRKRKGERVYPFLLLQLTVMLLVSLPAKAETTRLVAGVQPVKISIIIDDIGYRLKEGREIINLPAPITIAILPNAPKARQLAYLAHKQGKEVILHMPMQSTLGVLPEAGVLKVGMQEKEVAHLLQAAFIKVPHAVGMNNHQGSLLTRHPGHMGWVMTQIRKKVISLSTAALQNKPLRRKLQGKKAFPL